MLKRQQTFGPGRHTAAMREVEQRAVAAYRERLGDEPEVVVSAPGRINLIGEHTDYNGGFVLPCAIDRRVAVATGFGPAGLYSADFDERRPLTDEREKGWVSYPRGIVWALRRAHHYLPPVQAAFAGDVPLGGGLSSSAAIEAATALALDTLCHLGLKRRELAVLCQRAENRFVGVNSGIMDQYASLLCRPDEALLVDCRSLEAEQVPLDLDAAGLTLLVCDTRIERGLASTGYNERRATCERAAATLRVSQLRDATEENVKALEGEELRRARHVVRENKRVLEAVTALRAEDFPRFGELMYASHDSLRDDYDVSTPELNAFVEEARAAGAPGARLTGAGFGGCAIALVATERAGELKESVRRGYAGSRFEKPEFYAFHPSAGAEIVS